MTLPDLSVYAVLDPAGCRGRSPVDVAAAAAHGGATLVQLRAKAAGGRAFVDLARAVKAALAPLGVPLVINDRADVAFAAGADGVHVGQDDLPPEEARRMLGTEAIVGLTVRSEAEAAALPAGAADYAGIGGVFATTSKTNANPPIGLDGLARIAGALRLRAPGLGLCAIAGVHHGNAREVVRAGVDGVAVVSALFGADDVRAAAARLAAVVREAKGGAA